MNKRMLGYLSWYRRRRHVHRRDVLDALLADLEGVRPDHVAITGDMTHLGTPEECREVADWLPGVGPPAAVTLVPGNHDTYVPEPWSETLGLWDPYMTSDDGLADRENRDGPFPSLRIRGSCALIGVSSASPTAPFLAVGHVGPNQLRDLGRILTDAASAGHYRIVLIHHAPAPGSIKWRKRLTDAESLAALIEAAGAELILHGHAHESSINWLPSPNGEVPVIGVCSASEVNPASSRLAQYHLYRVEKTATGWLTRLSVREYSPEHREFVALGDWRSISDHRPDNASPRSG
jgi:3',5'-cyclic AMP phosphodiesterase CpdA